MLPAAPEFVEVTHRADLDVLLIRWMRKVTLEEMCAGYHYVLERAAEHRCRQWLLDARRRFNTDRDGAHWMITSFLPTLHARLGGRTYLAYLLVPVIMRDVEADAAFPPASFFEGKPFAAERFIDEREAVAWLQEARQQPVA
ncbi:hypothetical protein MUN84_11045 [Hymenobacter sp. 5516J-16]|uniref:STAS/SEC14 domain-containing protein n=1 Tax=Hymenobacter sublimis TaxID=2933777 RepID=A0ABY4J810_9BACT|nr:MULTISPECIES: hypothetical protein [Hymenobacter]UOQ79005.1 hypothetical protein MUN84_11045 [Hymenobacter sp. 5516J-16]UPL48952.1 hypothetical protein MWH26_17410 [Hymenobacter sublimis]